MRLNVVDIVPSMPARLDAAKWPPLGDFLCAINEASNVDGVLLAVAKTASLLTGASSSVLLLRNDGGTELQIRASTGACVIPRLGIPLDHRLARPLVWSGEANTLSQQADASLIGKFLLLRSCPTSSIAVMPLWKDGETCLFGALLLEFQDHIPAELSQDAVLRAFLNHATLALVRTQEGDDLRRKVADLSALVAVDEALNSTDSDKVLGEAVERVKTLIDAEIGSLFLHDAAINALVMHKSTLGNGATASREMRISLGETTMVPEVFRSGQAHVSRDAVSDPAISQALRQRYGVLNCICVPLHVDRRRIGVLTIANKRSGNFSDNDLELLRLLSSHLGAVIHNATLLSEQRRAVAQLRELNQTVELQHQGLQRTLAIHDELTRMVLEERELATIVSVIGQLLGNPVAVTDHFGRVISSWPPDLGTALGRQQGSKDVEDRAFEKLAIDFPKGSGVPPLAGVQRSTRLTLDNSTGSSTSFVVVPIIVVKETLGFVWVMESNRRLDELDFLNLDRAATAVALHVMRERAVAETRFKLHGDLLRELLNGRPHMDETLHTRAACLGIDLFLPRRVVAIRSDGLNPRDNSGGKYRVGVMKSEVVDAVERLWRRTDRDPLLTTVGNDIVILVRSAGVQVMDECTDVESKVESLRKGLSEELPRLAFVAGIGGRSESFSEYARSYQEARYVLDVMSVAHLGDRTLAHDRLANYSVLFADKGPDGLPLFVQRTLGKLLENDRRHAGQLTDTLETYLLQDGHLQRTADVLHIHMNTLRYRLACIERITGADLHLADTKFNLQLALKVWRVLHPAKG